MSSSALLTLPAPTVSGRQGRELDIDSSVTIDFGDHDNLQALAAAFAAGGRRGSGLFATEDELFELDKRLGTLVTTSTDLFPTAARVDTFLRSLLGQDAVLPTAPAPLLAARPRTSPRTLRPCR